MRMAGGHPREGRTDMEGCAVRRTAHGQEPFPACCTARTVGRYPGCVVLWTGKSAGACTEGHADV